MCHPIKAVNKYDQEYDYTSMVNTEVYRWRARTFQWLKDNYQK